MKKIKTIYSLLILLLPALLPAQEKQVRLTLPGCIEIAIDNTLTALQAKNVYLAAYWEYRTYQAQRLPSATLQLTPIQYNSNFIKRYDYNQNIEVYRQQQSYSASGGLSIYQNFDLTGGTFSLDTELNFMRNFGDNVYTQYSSVPIRIGYSQSLFGFNSFKWQRKIEPLKYEKAKKQFLYSREEIAEKTVSYFFNLAAAQAEYELAVENIASTDSLYAAGKERRRIASISEADLMTLELDLINAENNYENVVLQLERALSSFRSFLNMDNDTEIELELPHQCNSFLIPEEDALLLVKSNNPVILSYRQQILEAEQAVDRTSKTAGFDASLSASVGFNQAAEFLKDVYSDPLRQDVFRISVSIPVVDWGIRKGKVNMAKNNLNATKLSVQQNEQDLEQEVSILISEFNKQQNLIQKATKALNIAVDSYTINKRRFIIGKADINTVTLSLNRRKEAQRNYISSLKNYWRCYYNIRKLTLYDFEKKMDLSFSSGNLARSIVTNWLHSSSYYEQSTALTR